MKPIVLMRYARDALGYGGLLAWFAWGSLVMSWAGHRPLAPDRDHPYAYENHGLMYVSEDDLRASHVCLAVAMVFLVSMTVVHFTGRRMFAHFEDDVQSSSRRDLHAPGTWVRLLLFGACAATIILLTNVLGRAGR